VQEPTPCNERFFLQVLSWCSVCAFIGLCSIAFIHICCCVLLFQDNNWPVNLTLVLALVSTLLSLCRELPFQNAIAACVISGVVGVVFQVIYAAATATRFDPTCLWLISINAILITINARGLARLFLQRLRHKPNYGVLLLLLTTFLASAGAFFWPSLEKLGFQVSMETRMPDVIFYTALLSFLSLVSATPFLINKRPYEQAPTWQPVFIWLGLNAVFLCNLFLPDR